MFRFRWRPAAGALVAAAAAVALVMVPMSGAGEGIVQKKPTGLLKVLSSGPTSHYYARHPDAAPEENAGLDALAQVNGGSDNYVGQRSPGSFPSFNDDIFGLPQNEESIETCDANANVVLGGTNDYRGLLDPLENFTGWHLSLDSGLHLFKEGLLPAIAGIPSGGDPVDRVEGAACDLYSADLNYDPFDPFTQPNGIGVYKTTLNTLKSAACNPSPDTTMSDPDCWPTRKIVAFTPQTTCGVETEPLGCHFFDKEWMDVGNSGAAGRVVWVTYSDFAFPTDFSTFNSRIFAVRCDGNLNNCTAPILISGGDIDTQFSYVTIAPDGSVMVTWVEIKGELEGLPQTFIIKSRHAAPGSTVFGPVHTVFTETRPLPFGGKLQANDFRIATVPKNTAATRPDGKNRWFVIWDACKQRLFGDICIHPQIKLSWSDDRGATWTGPKLLTVDPQNPQQNTVNYFPWIDYDPTNGVVAAGWYTHRYDPDFENRQDVEVMTLDPMGVLPVGNGRRRITVSNETESDPFFSSIFIGDYFEGSATNGFVWSHFNANYRKVPILFATDPINQQDNFLLKDPE